MDKFKRARQNQVATVLEFLIKEYKDNYSLMSHEELHAIDTTIDTLITMNNMSDRFAIKHAENKKNGVLK